jgi:glycosyltransferase involved in cell wall biosynthesis
MPSALAGFILPARGKKSLCHIHSEGMVKLYHQSGPLRRWLYRTGFRRYDIIFVVNESLRDFATEVLGVSEERIRVMPAFIPPSDRAIEEAHLPEDAARFIQSHAPNLCASGSFGVYHGGENSYGLELLLDMLKGMQPEHPRGGLVLAINYVDDVKHQERFEETVKKLGLENNVLVLKDLGNSYLDLVQRSDVFLRPTYTEGDAVSVREALYLGVPVVASDCTFRPKGCVLFKTGDLKDCVAKVIDVVSNMGQARAMARSYEDLNTARMLVDVYREMIDRMDR